MTLALALCPLGHHAYLHGRRFIHTCAAVHALPALCCSTGVRQVNHMRHKYLAAVLRQDVGYFDTTATSGEQAEGISSSQLWSSVRKG